MFGDLKKVFQSEVDQFENHVVQKITETMNTQLQRLKRHYGNEIEVLTQRVKRLDDKDECDTERMVIMDKCPQQDSE